MSEWEAQEQHLLEMFPKCSLSEARSALSIAKGDMDEAVRLIIEGDVQLSPTPLNVSLRDIKKNLFSLEMLPRLLSQSYKIAISLIISHPQVNQGKNISSLADQKLKESILEK